MLTQILLVANIIIFSIFNVVLGKNTCGESWEAMCVNDNFLLSFAQVNHLVITGERVYQVFTSMFVHAFFFHLLWNMLSIWYFGSKLERRSGSLTFLGVYFSSGIIANIASLALGPAIVAGASGAVFGVVGAYMLLIVRSKGAAIPALIFIIGIHLPLLVGANVNVLGHVMGLATGTSMALRKLGRPKLSISSNYYDKYRDTSNPS
jgi:rhomboid protease GluP